MHTLCFLVFWSSDIDSVARPQEAHARDTGVGHVFEQMCSELAAIFSGLTVVREDQSWRKPSGGGSRSGGIQRGIQRGIQISEGCRLKDVLGILNAADAVPDLSFKMHGDAVTQVEVKTPVTSFPRRHAKVFGRGNSERSWTPHALMRCTPDIDWAAALQQAASQCLRSGTEHFLVTDFMHGVIGVVRRAHSTPGAAAAAGTALERAAARGGAVTRSRAQQQPAARELTGAGPASAAGAAAIAGASGTRSKRLRDGAQAGAVAAGAGPAGASPSKQSRLNALAAQVTTLRADQWVVETHTFSMADSPVVNGLLSVFQLLLALLRHAVDNRIDGKEAAWAAPSRAHDELGRPTRSPFPVSRCASIHFMRLLSPF